MSEMTGLESELKALPTWSYGLIAAVLAGGGLWYYRKREADASSSAVAATTETSADTTTLADDALTGSGTDSASQDATDASSGGSSDSSTALSTNLIWEAQALGSLSAKGYSPITVQSALEAYLNGGTLDSEAQVIVNTAIAQFGLPPEGTAGPVSTTTTTVSVSKPPVETVTPKPTTATTITKPVVVTRKPAPPAAKPKTYTVKSGDTLTSIAAANGVSEATLYSVNANALNAEAKAHGKPSSDAGHWIYPGTVLTL